MHIRRVLEDPIRTEDSTAGGTGCGTRGVQEGTGGSQGGNRASREERWSAGGDHVSAAARWRAREVDDGVCGWQGECCE